MAGHREDFILMIVGGITLDPDTGNLLWRDKPGRGSALGGVLFSVAANKDAGTPDSGPLPVPAGSTLLVRSSGGTIDVVVLAWLLVREKLAEVALGVDAVTE